MAIGDSVLSAVPPSQRKMRYDETGNLTNDNWSSYGSSSAGAITRTYDAENRMTSALDSSGGFSDYTYNADGQRVRRKNSGVETWQVYGMDGELLAEYAANTAAASPQKEYGYRNGQLLITATVAVGGWGAPPSFTPPAVLLSGGDIKLEHLTELRTAVNQLRSHAGLAAASFTVDPNPVRYVTPVKADHILQLRSALEEARIQLGLSTGGYAHPGLHATDFIFAIDFQELRNQILSAWNSGGTAGGIEWLVVDQLGTPRMVFDQTGALANVKRHDYLPFGEELLAGTGSRTTGQGYVADNIRQKFTQKERDVETGLDYFGARYYSSTQGRFTSVDPVFFQAAMTIDPQRFNLYAYTRNNPLKFIDPEGEAIELSSDKDERERELAALRLAVGKQAGAYLYGNLEKDGKYYLGVYTNGPDGKGKDFKDLNEVTGEIAPIIADTKVASLEIVAVGTQITVESGDKYTMTPSENCNCIAEGTTAVAGLTIKGADANHFRILLPMSAIGSALDPVPEEQMSNDEPGQQDWGIVMGHELGHVRARMTGDDSNPASLRLENKVRKLRDKNAPTIDYHSRREALRAKSTMVSP